MSWISWIFCLKAVINCNAYYVIFFFFISAPCDILYAVVSSWIDVTFLWEHEGKAGYFFVCGIATPANSDSRHEPCASWSGFVCGNSSSGTNSKFQEVCLSWISWSAEAGPVCTNEPHKFTFHHMWDHVSRSTLNWFPNDIHTYKMCI